MCADCVVDWQCARPAHAYKDKKRMPADVQLECIQRCNARLDVRCAPVCARSAGVHTVFRSVNVHCAPASARSALLHASFKASASTRRLCVQARLECGHCFIGVGCIVRLPGHLQECTQYCTAAMSIVRLLGDVQFDGLQYFRESMSKVRLRGPLSSNVYNVLKRQRPRCACVGMFGSSANYISRNRCPS